MDHTNPMPIGTKNNKIDITLENKTKSISKKISKNLVKGDIIFLFGNIGVGKTTFAKYLINFLQSRASLKKTEVPSPTFNLMNESDVKNFVVRHFDLYRLKKFSDIENIGLYENLKETVTLIEWPELLKDKINNRIDLIFGYEGNYSKRSISIISKKTKLIYNDN